MLFDDDFMQTLNAMFTTNYTIPSLPPNVPPIVSEPRSPCQEYRRNYAIPRYLAKRERRVWDQRIIHPSRRVVALARDRVGGKFKANTVIFKKVTSGRITPDVKLVDNVFREI